MKTMSILRRLFLAIAVAMLGACTFINPDPLSREQLLDQARTDRVAAHRDVPPIEGALTLDETLARALKYNLERRTKLLEEAMAFRQLDIASYDMLPRLLARVDYSTRNNDSIRQSRNVHDGSLSESRFISQERSHTLGSLGMSWSLLDLGVGYFNTRQQADRLLIASERRRRAMHILMQDVRTAFWRAASAQKLRGQVRETIAMAEAALESSRTEEVERLRSPMVSLRYQRQVLENLRLLETIDQELSTAQLELAALINAPLGEPLILVEPEFAVRREALRLPLEQMEEVALIANADLREQHYNARIAREEARKTLVRLFPNVTFNYGTYYDTDNYLVNSSWNEAGVQISWNLFNLLTGPGQLKLAGAGVKLADQRRVAVQMAVLAQVHLARLQLANAIHRFDRANALWSVDQRLAEHMRNGELSKTQSRLDRVANQTSAILSLLRRYEAQALAQSAEARLQATLGVEPQIGSVGEISLQELTQLLATSAGAWNELAAELGAAAY